MSAYSSASWHPSRPFSLPSGEKGPDLSILGNLLERAKRHVSGRLSDWTDEVELSLWQIARDCSISGWDGHGAAPIRAAALLRARDFMCGARPNLKSTIPAPIVTPEADGELSITWELEPERIFSVSIGEGTLVHYAGLLGNGVERNGIEPFISWVPHSILQSIEELYASARTPIASRAA